MAVKILVTLSLIIAFVSGLPTQSPTVNEVTENDFSSLIDPHPETFDNRLIEDPGKFEGDIIVEKNDAPTTANGIRGKFAAPNDYNLWPKGVIPYQIQGSVGNQARNNIKQAIEHIQRKTCIRFKERTSADAYFVNIIRGNGSVLNWLLISDRFSFLMSSSYSVSWIFPEFPDSSFYFVSVG